MSALRDLQFRFVRTLMGFEEEGFLQEEVGGGRLPAEDRVAIYRNNMLANRRHALRGVYPVLVKLVGDEFFNALAREYARRLPSASGDLRRYGSQLDAFLERFTPTRELPYLPHMAQLEWAVHQSFHAAHHPPLDLARLAEMPPERQPALRFRLHPAAVLVASPYPIARIWQVNQDHHTGDQGVGLDAGGEQVLVWRPQFKVQVRPLDRGEYALLDAIALRATLEHAAAAAMAADARFDLQSSLAWLVEQSVIVDFE